MKRTILHSGLFIFIFLFLSSHALSETIVIKLEVRSCQAIVQPILNNGCDQNQCGADKECACVSVDDRIQWVMLGKARYKLNFNQSNPLKDCGDNFSEENKTCAIKDSMKKGEQFNYAIQLENCDTATDPRIVIK